MNAVGVLLDGVASYPDMVDIGSSNYTPSETVKRLEEKICRRLCDTVADKEQLKLDILAYTAKKYDEIDNTRHLSDVIQAELRKAVPLSVSSEELFDKVVSHIRIQPDGNISLELINSQVIGEEDFIQYDAADNAGEEGHGHSAAS